MASGNGGNENFPTMCFNNNVALNWKKWKQRLEIYLTATGKDGAAEKVKIAILLDKIGEEGIDIYNTFVFETQDTKFNDVIKQFDSYCVPFKNVTMETYKFNTIKQKDGQSFDTFVTELRNQAMNCEFVCANKDCKTSFMNRMLKDKLVISIADKGCQEKLLREPELSLEKALEFCRVVETSKTHSKLLESRRVVESECEQAVDVDVIRKKFGNWRHNNGYPKQNESSMLNKECTKCGKMHQIGKCPAYGKTCLYCGGKNHFANGCFKKKSNFNKPSINQVETRTGGEQEESADLFGVKLVGSIDANEQNADWREDLYIGENIVRFKLDTGADINVLPAKYIGSGGKLDNTSLTLKAYGNFIIKPIGVCTLKVQTKYNVEKNVKFVIIDQNLEPLLSGQTCVELNFIKRIASVCAQVLPKEGRVFVETFKAQFEGLGCIPGEYSIKLKKDYIGVVNPNRRVPFGLYERLERTLVDLEKREIISKVDYPTEFVNSMIIVEKPNGSLRICIDPKHLNCQILREHYKIPTSDEIMSRLSNKKVFTVVDMREGFWQIRLDKNSSDLCCFNTPFGRYKFNRLPFGVSVAPEVFQKTVSKIFGVLDNVETYFDDLIIAGENEQIHDEALNNVMKLAKQYNIKFNSDKLQYKTSSVRFMGQVIFEGGIKPDPKHIRAIKEIETPKDKKELMRILGIFKFLSKFMSNMSATTASLRELTKDNVPFIWEGQHDQALSTLKDEICSEPVLSFFDINKPITVQTDASKDGLGCCLMQDDHPIAYASRALTSTEQKYAQIEKELLAVVFATDKFYQFLYGHRFVIQSDHKPLVSISKKDVNKVSVRLQRMLLKIMRFEFEIVYVPGRDMHIADALSRSFIKDKVEDDPELQFVVHSLSTDISMTPIKRKQFKEETQSDPVLSKVYEFKLNNKWPPWNKLSPGLKHYFKNRDDIFISDAILFLNRKVIVPQTMKNDMLKCVHTGHLGMEKTLLKARELIYWPNMAKDIQDFVSRCSACQKFRGQNCKEPLRPYQLAKRPWERVCADIFELYNKYYLVIVDSYSNWIELAQIKTKTALEVIHVFKEVFSRLGIPDKITSDNNPFSSFLFKLFCKDYGIEYSPSSPLYAKSNGLAEKAVGICKQIIKKSQESREEITLGLMEYRNTPLKFLGFSPSQLLMSRNMRTKIPCLSERLQPKVIDPNLIQSKLNFRQNQQVKYYNRSARPLPALFEGEHILWRKDRVWVPAKVIKCFNDNSFLVRDERGGTFRRNRVFLRKTLIAFNERVELIDHYDSVSPGCVSLNKDGGVEQIEMVNSIGNDLNNVDSSLVESVEDLELSRVQIEHVNLDVNQDLELSGENKNEIIDPLGIVKRSRREIKIPFHLKEYEINID